MSQQRVVAPKHTTDRFDGSVELRECWYRRTLEFWPPVGNRCLHVLQHPILLFQDDEVSCNGVRIDMVLVRAVCVLDMRVSIESAIGIPSIIWLYPSFPNSVST